MELIWRIRSCMILVHQERLCLKGNESLEIIFLRHAVRSSILNGRMMTQRYLDISASVNLCNPPTAHSYILRSRLFKSFVGEKSRVPKRIHVAESFLTGLS